MAGMVDNTRDMASATSVVLKTVWVLAAAIVAFTVENIWIDPWLARRSHHKLPSFVPEALGGAWLLILLALAITVILLVVCQVLLMRDARIALGKKAATGILVVTAALLSGGWIVTTSGITFPKLARTERESAQQKRSVVLRWQASTTPNVRYNIYRGPFSGVHPDKLNSTPIDGTTFTDATVVSGQTYWYVVRAINNKDEESSDSNDTSATIP
jgi:hypothetical protein